MPADPPILPDALWQLVSSCLDGTAGAEPSYCTCPAMARACCGDASTPDASVVWAESPQFVVVRDLSMCGCAATGNGTFVAGLALPRARISGIEDPARPDAIWPFAWQVARAHIGNEDEIALVINPDDARTQNQMHVHLLRLKPGVRARLESAGGVLDPAPALRLRLPDLQGVFSAALARVGADAIGRHGILVMSAAGGGYLAVLTDGSSPQVFTQNRCAAS